MDESQLNITIKAKDEASQTLKQVSDNVAQAGNKISSSTQTATTSFRNMFGAMLGSQVAFSAIQKGFGLLTGFIKDSVKAADEAQEVQAQLYAVLSSTGQAAGVTADQAIELSKSLQATTTFSDEAVLSAENMLLTFTKIKSDVFPQATQTVLDMATALGTDTKSAAIQLGKALQDPIQGVSALRRVGVSFNDDQQKMIANLVETGRQLDAQNYILKELATEFGGSASQKAETFAGKVEQIKNKINDAQEVIGGAMEASLYTLVQQLSTATGGALTNAEAMEQLGYTVYKATNFIIAMGQAVATVGKAIGVGVGTIKTGVTALVDASANVAAKSSGFIDKLFGKKEMSGVTQALTGFAEATDDQLTASVDKLLDKGTSVANSWKNIGETLNKTKDDYDEMRKKMEDNIKAIQKQQLAQQSAVGTAKGLTEAQKKHADAVSTLTETYEKMSDNGITSLAELEGAFKSKMKSINDSIASTKASIKQLTADYNRSQGDNTKNVAEQIVASEMKIADLKKQLLSATTVESIRSLREQLAAEQTNYDSSAGFREANAAAIEEARRRASETELQRLIEDSAAKAALETEEYTRRLSQLKQELKDKQAEAKQETAIYNQKVEIINKLLVDANTLFKQLSAERVKTTTDEVNAQIKKYQELAAAINAVKSATGSSVGTIKIPTPTSVPKHEQGGFVDAPRGRPVAIIAHGGEQIIPAEQTGRRGGAGIMVVINNPQVRSTEDVDEIRKQIESVFRDVARTYKLQPTN